MSNCWQNPEAVTFVSKQEDATAAHRYAARYCINKLCLLLLLAALTTT